MNNFQILNNFPFQEEIPLTNYTKSTIKIGNYEIIKTIGEGTFGKVKLGKNIPTEELVAIKIFEKSKINDDDDLTCINNEIQFLKNLNHPNIISLYEIIESETNIYIIMEYAEKELFSYIVSNNYLSEKEASNFYIQILSVIEYIHNNKIVHRDLKPENILLSNDNKILKIIDFGLANNYNDNLLETQCGSLCYSAPEMILGKKYKGIDIDIWSSGIILFAMVSGFLPFDDENDENIYKKVAEGKFNLPDKLSDDCKDLIKKILVVEPSQRIQFCDIIKHPFLKGNYDKYKKENLKKYKFNGKNCFSNKEEEKNIEIYDVIIDKMIKMKIKGVNKVEDIIQNIKENKFNEITSIYKLLLKKYSRNKMLYSISTTPFLNKKFKFNHDFKNKNDNNNSLTKTRPLNNYSNKNKINNINQINAYNNKINLNVKEREIISYKAKNNIDSFKINSFSIDNQNNISSVFQNKKKLNKITKKKNDNELNSSIKKGTVKKDKNLIQKYINLMNSIKNSMINRNSKKMTDLSVSFEKKNNLIYFPIKKKKVIISSIHNLTESKLSFINSSSIDFKDKRSKNYHSNSNSKSHKKKSLSIITSSNLNLENNLNINLHKRVISNINSTFYNHDYKKRKIIKGNIKKNNLNESKRRKKSKEISLNINVNSYRSSILVNKNKEKVNQNKTVIQRYNNYFTESAINSSYYSNKILLKKKFNKNHHKKRFLNTIFINLSKNSKSKSPNNTKINTSNNNSKNIKSKKDNNISIRNYSPFQKNKILFSVNQNRNEFACCSTNYSLEEIIKKLNELCIEKKYKFKSIDETNFYVSNKENVIYIEVSFFSEKNILKMFHNSGNDKITKEIINNIIMEIGF